MRNESKKKEPWKDWVFFIYVGKQAHYITKILQHCRFGHFIENQPYNRKTTCRSENKS